MADRTKKEAEIHFDSMFDRSDLYSTGRCTPHRHLTDQYGDCPYCLSGIDPLGQFPDPPKPKKEEKKWKR